MMKTTNPTHTPLTKTIFLFCVFLLVNYKAPGQVIDNNGCVGANFGIDAGLYSNILEFGDQSGAPAAGTRDWFWTSGPVGLNIIDQTNPSEIKNLLQTQPNPTYVRRMSSELSSIVNGQILIDGVYCRDEFGGTGGIDQTAFDGGSKNGVNPALWTTGPKNVLGKADIIDAGAHMFRDGITFGNGDLWFVGLMQRADPGGDAYLDFEFFVQEVTYTPGSGFSSGGSDLGHTAFQFDASGKFTSIGDFIFNVILSNGGTTLGVDIRLWVSQADYAANRHPAGFTWGSEFDGAFSGAPYGYALIVPTSTPEACGIINLAGQNPLAPPWGTRNTKYNSWGTTYSDFSVAELMLNLSRYGIDNAILEGGDPCKFPMHTFLMKSRTSNSFSSSLKDFSGPFQWGQPVNTTRVVGDPILSCLNTDATLSADPIRMDATYSWTTIDGQITGNPNQPAITVTQPGTYKLHTYLTSTGCPIPDVDQAVAYNPAKPFFNTPTYTSTVSCNGNDGSIDLTVTGANLPYSYAWTKDGSPYSATTEDLIGLQPGTYIASITNAEGCHINSDGIIVAPRIPVNMSSVNVSHVSCSGYKDGAVNLTVSGGQQPLSYLWSTGNTGEDLLNTSAGSYTLMVTDASGCLTTATYTVVQPPVITASIVKINDDADPAPVVGTGAVNLTVSGGTPAYTYAWSGPNGYLNSSEDPNNFDYGSYTVIAKDSKNCTATARVFIYEPESCNDGIDNDGDGLTDCYDEAICKPVAPGIINASDNTPCPGSEFNTTYSVAVNAGYDSYIWTYPADAIYVAGQGSNVLTVYWNSTAGGQICVQGKKYECIGAKSCENVIVKDVLPRTGEISIN